jgi:hypothetical protein
MSDQVVENAVVDLELPLVEGFKGLRNDALVNGVKYMQVVRASLELNMHPQYIAKLCKEGAIKAVRDEQKRIWIPAEAIDAYKAAKAAEPRRVPGERKAQKHVYVYIPQRVKQLRSAIKLLNTATDQMLDATSKNDVLSYFRGLLEVDLKAYLEDQATKKLAAIAAGVAPAAESAPDAAAADSDFQALIDEPVAQP